MKNLTALIILAICPAMFAANASPEQNYKQAEKLQKSEKNEEAFEYYLKAAKQGDAKTQYNLGVSYFYGVEKDLLEAVVWYRKAANQGFKRAQFALKFYNLDVKL